MNPLKSVPKELQILIILLILSLFFHLNNFSERLNFSTDQAKFSLKAWDLWQNREISLTGPSISLNLDGREIYQGGVIYYFLLIFLLFGNFNPLIASVLFSLFAVSASIALYAGLKMLFGKEKALAATAIYLLLPVFINYTGFLWNPNFQLALMPFLFLFLGLFKKYKRNGLLLVSGIWLGVLLQFHYQLVLGLVMLLIWFKLYLRISLFQYLVFLAGIAAGFLPVLIYEARNEFYNLKSLIYLFQHFSRLEGSGNAGHQHYYLSLLLIILVLFLSLIKILPAKALITLAGVLVIWDLIIFMPEPKQGFGMAKDWKFEDEQKVAQIIKEKNLDGYNFTNLEYDSLYYVQKYFSKINGLEGKIKDYWETEKLFAVIKKDENPDEDPAYEIRIIKPYKQLGSWDINNYYKMYLFEKVGSLQGE